MPTSLELIIEQQLAASGVLLEGAQVAIDSKDIGNGVYCFDQLLSVHFRIHLVMQQSKDKMNSSSSSVSACTICMGWNCTLQLEVKCKRACRLRQQIMRLLNFESKTGPIILTHKKTMSATRN
jgi:hypothetical protein